MNARTLATTATLGLALAAVLTAEPAQGPDRASLIAMAKAGRVAEAWKIWESAPSSWENMRTGIALAAAVGDVSRGLTIYTRLTADTGNPELTPLGSLAVAAAGALSQDKDRAVTFGACGIVLRDVPSDATCAPKLATAGRGPDADREALDLYRLTNGGASAPPAVYAALRPKISGTARLEIATSLTRLASIERAELVAPIFENEADRSLRQPAASLLSEIGDADAMAALRGLAARPIDFQARVPVLIALAQHGDRQGLATAEQMRGVAVGASAIDGTLALSLAGSGGAPPLETLLNVAPPPTKAHIALVLRERYPDLAKSTVKALLSDPMPSSRQAALRAAGILGMGLDSNIYNLMLDPQPATRLQAVQAVLQTIDQQLGRAATRP